MKFISFVKEINKEVIKDICYGYNEIENNLPSKYFYIALDLFLNIYEKKNIKKIKKSSENKYIFLYDDVTTTQVEEEVEDYSYFLLYNFLIMKKENFSFKELIGYKEKDDINKTVENLNNICKKILLKIADETQNNEEMKMKLKVEKIIQFNLKQLAKYNNNICNLEEINI